MNWYYAAGGQQQGPVDDAQLDALIAAGTVRPDTLVWREGLANWQPLREARPMGAAAAAATPAPAPAMGIPAPLSAGTAGPAPGANEVRCGECGGVFQRDQTIQYGTVSVCAACKPVFLQKLREGTGTAAGGLGIDEMRYAGFWIRFGAKLLDGLILVVVLGIPLGILMFATGMIGNNQRGAEGAAVVMQLILNCGSILGAVAYNTFFLSKYGATPGKMAVGVKVVRSDGSPLTTLRAFGRAWGEQLSGLVCYIGYIIAGFDQQKRALHDHMSDTRVVYK